MTSILLALILSFSTFISAEDFELTQPLDLETECMAGTKNDRKYCKRLINNVYISYYFTVLLAYDRKEDFKPYQFVFWSLEYPAVSSGFNAFSYIALPLYTPSSTSHHLKDFMPGMYVPVFITNSSIGAVDGISDRLSNMLLYSEERLKLFMIPQSIQRRVYNDLEAASIFNELATAGATDCFLISDFMYKEPTLIMRDTNRVQGYYVKQLLTADEVAPYLLNCINLNYY